MKLRAWIGPILAMIIPLTVFEILRRKEQLDVLFVDPHGHFYIVSAVSILAIVIAVAVGIAGNRLRNMKVTFMALAYISLAGVFALHGLSTPGLILDDHRVTGIATQLSIFLASGWMALSALPADHRIIVALSRFRHGLVAGWTVIVIAIGVIGMFFPRLFHFIPIHQSPLQAAVTAFVIFLNLYTMYAYMRSYLYSKFPMQIAIVYGSAWFIASQWITVTGEIWRSSWWIYHYLLLAALIVTLVGFFKQYAVDKSVIKVIQAMFTVDPAERIYQCLTPSVKALIYATESRDTYTAGHNYRVTMYALRIAEEMRLSPEQQRALVQGAIVHDVGKLNIPDSILNKPDKLTDEERAVIETHPVKGYEMCRNLGFMTEELGVIRSHHERWDGSGYPDGLKGEQIPIAARIVAVADVYDALTSTRSYRTAWKHEAAMELLIAGKGIHFDPACVDAWIRVCERNPNLYRSHDDMKRQTFGPSASILG